MRILGVPRNLCAGLSRRDFIEIGRLGVLGLGLADVARLHAMSATTPSDSAFGKARACILLFPYGSPPQHETFDPKPEAPVEVRGELAAIPSSVPGLMVSEGLPRVARIMDRVTLIRSMTHPYPLHGVAYVTTGIPNYEGSLERDPRDPRHWPYVGSVVDYVLTRRSGGAVPDVPRNLVLPWKMNSQNQGMIATAGPYAAFLGPAYDPVVTEFVGRASRVVPKVFPVNGRTHQVADPFAGVEPDCHFKVAGTQLPDDITLDRLDARRSLVEQFDQARRRGPTDLQIESWDRYARMAYSTLTSPKIREALDVRREPATLREQYGMTLFGQACLTARRLVQAGAAFVTVFWDEVGPINTDWDAHWGLYPRLRDRLLPGFDLAFSALIADLQRQGMLEETLVLWMSEHGRTPKLNNNPGGGRDHWSRAYSIVMAGGGVAAGRVVGASDRFAGEVLDTPVSPKDILVTILHLLGIDARTTVPDRLGRPLQIAGEGRLRTELF